MATYSCPRHGTHWAHSGCPVCREEVASRERIYMAYLKGDPAGLELVRRELLRALKRRCDDGEAGVVAALPNRPDAGGGHAGEGEREG